MATPSTPMKRDMSSPLSSEPTPKRKGPLHEEEPAEAMDTQDEKSNASAESLPPEEIPDDVNNVMIYKLLMQSKREQATKADLQALNERVQNVEDQADIDAKEVEDLAAKLTRMETAMKIAFGKISQLEKENREQKRLITDLRSRSMRDNVIIKTKGDKYKEVRGEDTAQKVRDFAREELKLANTDHMKIVRAHRMGGTKPGANRPMIAKVLNAKDQNKMFSSAEALKGTDFEMRKQIPGETEERVQFFWPAYKKAKAEKKKVRIDQGSLFVEGELVEKYEPPKLPNASSYTLLKEFNQRDFGMAQKHESDGHTFQAVALKANSLQDVREAFDFLMHSKSVRSVDHLPYAFKFRDEDGMHENFDSDYDTFGGLQILRAMRKAKLNDMVVFVLHWNDSDTPRALDGRKRSEIMEEIVSAAADELVKAVEEGE